EGLTRVRLARLAERAALADDALEAKTAAAYAGAVLSRDAHGLSLDAARLAGEPREIALRLVLRALAELGLGRGGTAPRLERAESLMAALDAALAGGRTLERTLAGALIRLDRRGVLRLAPEGPRRRGAKASATPAAKARPGAARKGNTNDALALV